MLIHLTIGFVVSTLLAAPTAKVPDFITPYPGATLYGDTLTADFDEVDFVVAKIKGDPPNPSFKRVEGRVTQLRYTNPEGRSILEIFKNYEQALLKAGFEKVFACAKKECGETVGLVETWKVTNNFITESSYYISAKRSSPDGTTWASIYTTSIGLSVTTIRVAQEKPMETGLVTVNAAALKGGIERDGHVAVYGILFDTGKATIKAESANAFGEIKKLLDADADLKLYVVGHTDDVGDESVNQTLAQARAESVVKELVTKYKIAKARLTAKGVGPFVPVASNRNEAGRTKNRRVDLVEKTH